MFAQVNAEHCRHKIFNASWTLDGTKQPKSLFSVIHNTEEQCGSKGTISAYSDNAAVPEGHEGINFGAGKVRTRSTPSSSSSAPKDGGEKEKEQYHHIYTSQTAPILHPFLETHNHPTTVSPHPGVGRRD
jgi:phosphoribosylformylglycinamidine synthase